MIRFKFSFPSRTLADFATEGALLGGFPTRSQAGAWERDLAGEWELTGTSRSPSKGWKGSVTVLPIGIDFSFDTTQLSAFVIIPNLVESVFYVSPSDRNIGLIVFIVVA